MASTLLLGPHRGPRGRDKGQSSDHFGKGIGSLSHFASQFGSRSQQSLEFSQIVAGAGPGSVIAMDPSESKLEGEWELRQF